MISVACFNIPAFFIVRDYSLLSNDISVLSRKQGLSDISCFIFINMFNLKSNYNVLLVFNSI